MNCPTCAALMRPIVLAPPQGTWYCQRCGTRTCIDSEGRKESEAPELVSRCEMFYSPLRTHPDWLNFTVGMIKAAWERAGIDKLISAGAQTTPQPPVTAPAEPITDHRCSVCGVHCSVVPITTGLFRGKPITKPMCDACWKAADLTTAPSSADPQTPSRK